MKELMFPILGDSIIKALPWAVLAAHEAQAKRNHGQSLARLAQRGGLGIEEARLVLMDKEYPFDHKFDPALVRVGLMQLVAQAQSPAEVPA